MFVNNNTKQFCIALPFLLFDRSSLLIIFCRQVGGVFLELKTKFVFYDHCSIACHSFSTSSEHFLRYYFTTPANCETVGMLDALAF